MSLKGVIRGSTEEVLDELPGRAVRCTGSRNRSPRSASWRGSLVYITRCCAIGSAKKRPTAVSVTIGRPPTRVDELRRSRRKDAEPKQANEIVKHVSLERCRLVRPSGKGQPRHLREDPPRLPDTYRGGQPQGHYRYSRESCSAAGVGGGVSGSRRLSLVPPRCSPCRRAAIRTRAVTSRW